VNVDVRKGQGDVKLSREEFERRLRQRFSDPLFDTVAGELDRVIDIAWQTYDTYRKSPRTRKAGAGFADRLVCADGGNPDPTTTHGKKPEEAKDRLFSIVVHGDAAGAETLRRSLTDWLTDMALRPAAAAATIDRYDGLQQPRPK
jgi:hypothetical protein